MVEDNVMKVSHNFGSRDGTFPEVEWQVRCDLAACYRACIRYGWTDHIHTHISARHPTKERVYFINPYGLLFEEIIASNLIAVSFEGEVIEGDYPYNDAGHAIHSAIHRTRPDVNWVMHTHTRAGMAVSCMKCGLLPLTQKAMFLYGKVSYHPWDDLPTSGVAECERLAADLGDTNYALILNNHGLLTCAPTVSEVFATMYALEMACKVQVDLMASGTELIYPPEDAVVRAAKHSLSGETDWAAIRRWLDMYDPSYRT